MLWALSRFSLYFWCSADWDCCDCCSFLSFFFSNFYWNKVDLQCVSFRCTEKWFIYISDSFHYSSVDLQIHRSLLVIYFIYSGSDSVGHSVVSNSLWPHGLYSPWNSLGQNTGVVSRSLLQGITPTQGSNPGLPHCRQILYQPSHLEAQEYWSG